VPSPADTPAEVLAALAAALAQVSAAWYVFGAQAATHGASARLALRAGTPGL
jgi:hypothetical protein